MIERAELKPIETVYNGYRFRSRLEARWAVFFDALGIPYEYEKEGYDLGQAGLYLPDFWLPTLKMWGEVKGDACELHASWRKCAVLAQQSGSECVTLFGLPGGGFTLDETNHGLAIVTTDGRIRFTPYNDVFSAPVRDCQRAILRARQARFEHGEKP